MNGDPTLGELDRNGAVEEATAALVGPSRAALLGGAVLGTGALLALLAEPAQAAIGPSDIEIWQDGLAGEYGFVSGDSNGAVRVKSKGRDSAHHR